MIKKRNAIFKRIISLLVIVSIVALSPAPANSIVVEDMVNLSQNILQVIQLIMGYINQLSGLANQATEIAHLYFIVESWIKNLEDMNIDILLQLAVAYMSEYGEYKMLMDSCVGLMSALNQLDIAIENLFVELKIDKPLSGEEFFNTLEKWDSHILDTAADGKNALKILNHLSEDAKAVDETLDEVAHAAGTKAVLQGMATLQGLTSTQLSRLSLLIGHEMDMTTSEASIESAKQMQARKQLDAARKDYTKHTDIKPNSEIFGSNGYN